MNNPKINELIKKFNLKNDLTKNFNIWVGHAKIGYRNRPSINEVKKILLEIFDEFIEEYEPTPERLKETLSQWENFHPYQKVREIDQPMFVSREGEKIIVAVIWPWQIKEGVASLMLYEGKFIE
ncbi:hypothetical protein DRN73_04590 [Candidatus Pacearchaeota archaeon]|nr:MAG: hypothetical protein DRN73_04590 [Candidatus Pacearchaeota archaeon]